MVRKLAMFDSPQVMSVAKASSIPPTLGSCGDELPRRSARDGFGRRCGLMKNASTVAPTPRHTGRHSTKVTPISARSAHDGKSIARNRIKGIEGSSASAKVANRSDHPSCWKNRRSSFSLLTKMPMAHSIRDNAHDRRKSDPKEALGNVSARDAKANTTPHNAIASTTPKVLSSSF